MKKSYYLILLSFNLLFSDYIDVQFASFSFTTGGSYGSCANFKKSQYDFSNFNLCSCAWAANVSDYPSCYELYYNPQTKMIKYNLFEGGQYTYRNFSSDYTCHNYVEEDETVLEECSELDQNTCNHPAYGEGCEWVEGDIDCHDLNTESTCSDNDCDWVEDLSTGSCVNLTYDQCTHYSNNGCAWEYGCIQMGWWYNWCYEYGYECEGTYQIDNSYCDGENGYCEESWDMLGDLNFDGTINIQDVIQIIELILNQQYNVLADMNYDNTVNVADVIQIINIILN